MSNNWIAYHEERAVIAANLKYKSAKLRLISGQFCDGPNTPLARKYGVACTTAKETIDNLLVLADKIQSGHD